MKTDQERMRIALEKIESLFDEDCVRDAYPCPKCAALELVRRVLDPTKTDKQ